MNRRTMIIDTETTGFSGRDEVLEIGAVILERTRPIAHFSGRCAPSKPLGPQAAQALKLQGITEVEARNFPPQAAIWNAFLAWATLFKPVDLVLAYNAAFDRRLMQQTFPESVALGWGPCIMRAASEEIRGDRRNMSLVDAHRRLVGFEHEGAHTALADAQAATRIAIELFRRGWDPRAATP